ncbi:hypothetical protein LAZ67_13001872 [Cordylochernes scorpioides]|uniref:Uncharacterized protein n=1 Tax=Cordylochernes scorpioides TaxID=51811 RepID=A0ABY6L469_9ARAC|nr:hypothetical protein LAZ67_13001872 [Cordylochernes scorpioides]
MTVLERYTPVYIGMRNSCKGSRRKKLRGVLQASCCLKRSDCCLPPTPVYFLEDSRRFYELLSSVLLLLSLTVLQLESLPIEYRHVTPFHQWEVRRVLVLNREPRIDSLHFDPTEIGPTVIGWTPSSSCRFAPTEIAPRVIDSIPPRILEQVVIGGIGTMALAAVLRCGRQVTTLLFPGSQNDVQQRPSTTWKRRNGMSDHRYEMREIGQMKKENGIN